MKKIFLAIGFVLIIVVVGLFAFNNPGLKELIDNVRVVKKITPKPLPPIFDKMAAWVPMATWKEPEKISEITPYGKVSGLEMNGEIRGKNASINRNFENVKTMNDLGYFEDMQFAADGPGSSNWGYAKEENGKTRVAIFRYSTNHLLGPESNSPPFVNLSVFVSEPFVRE